MVIGSPRKKWMFSNVDLTSTKKRFQFWTQLEMFVCPSPNEKCHKKWTINIKWHQKMIWRYNDNFAFLKWMIVDSVYHSFYILYHSIHTMFGINSGSVVWGPPLQKDLDLENAQFNFYSSIVCKWGCWKNKGCWLVCVLHS